VSCHAPSALISSASLSREKRFFRGECAPISSIFFRGIDALTVAIVFNNAPLFTLAGSDNTIPRRARRSAWPGLVWYYINRAAAAKNVLVYCIAQHCNMKHKAELHRTPR